jgi:Trm5-related predicted tRNA methylase
LIHAYFNQFAEFLSKGHRRAVPGADKRAVIASQDSKIRADRLRSEIAQLEARYDGLFSPGVYSILKNLRRELAALDKTA